MQYELQENTELNSARIPIKLLITNLKKYIAMRNLRLKNTWNGYEVHGKILFLNLK
jgi:hypothetical protein